ncbi:octanoyl-[acyl-carrier-protein]:protein N-octanoyltransferase LIPT2, mitochondrial-like isoform X2 [Babylonia areolata]|uniref:octanoyl-[acyl-carrier-protein]:protein N-octanoyltransferase LIPT2, mitochondrial-like isoform X2 n=1 Tax=Babylonia areolata TaxID=304850 RepID=UPI003FD1BEFC
MSSREVRSAPVILVAVFTILLRAATSALEMFPYQTLTSPVAMAATASSRVVQVINLGRMGFLEAFDIQMRYARPHLDEIACRPNAVGHDTLLLVEHNPVYTVGVRTQDYDEVEEKRLKALGAEFYRTNRGGLITFHGPGQLVAYPILNLRHFQPSVRKYVENLEMTLVETCRRFGLKARTTEHTGVWVDNSKIAAIGIHVTRFVTTHGIALNCNTDLSWFRHIVPCGIPGKDVTSLTQLLGRDTPVKKVVAPFLTSFQEQFNCELEYGLFDAEDASLLKEGGGGEEEGGPGQKGHGHASPPPAQAAQGVRQLSTSAASASTAPRASRPRVSMW